MGLDKKCMHPYQDQNGLEKCHGGTYGLFAGKSSTPSSAGTVQSACGANVASVKFEVPHIKKQNKNAPLICEGWGVDPASGS